KGHDRIITVLPRIIARVPNVSYLIVGCGDGLDDLKQFVLQAGLQQNVVFAGHVEDDELADHYRTADAFVMPSTGEGFGIVFIQAAACGLPVVGGCVDGSWDALREGRIGQAIDPRDDTELVNAIIAALTTNRYDPQKAHDAFDFLNFEKHVACLLKSIVAAPGDYV
ncbi:MAG: glycosyltransferase, partial [Pseudomonadota bacterium]